MALSREQKIAKARVLRAKGWTLREIAKLIGVSTTTALRWTDPQIAERDRAGSREYKDRNREAMRAYDREYNRTHKAECPRCGGGIPRSTGRRGGKCAGCHHVDVDQRARKLERLWSDGKTFPELMEEFGWSKGQLGREMHRFRELGYALPYRYEHHVKAPRFPEQVAA